MAKPGRTVDEGDTRSQAQGEQRENLGPFGYRVLMCCPSSKIVAKYQLQASTMQPPKWKGVPGYASQSRQSGISRQPTASVANVLPVEGKTGTRWGNALLEIKKLDLHNKLGVIFVMPTFSHLPWYCDHPTDPKIRQETYFVKVVVPFVERTYPVTKGSEGRLLLGFSKSGCGAFSSLLRHPDFFGKAAAWDAPLNMMKPNRYGMGPIFGTQKNFDKYNIPTLLAKRAKQLRTQKRLGIIGYSNFRGHHKKIHGLLIRLKIPHFYQDVRQGKHHWNSGWLEDAVRF